MITLAIDFETSGLTRKGLPLDDPSQPHILEIGAVEVNDDDFEANIQQSIIYPDGWTVEDEAAKIHGITTKLAREVGIPIDRALHTLMGMVRKADVVIAHNMEFERRLIEMELIRLKRKSQPWQDTKKLCTMELSTPVLKLQGQFDDYKYPKLIEAHAYLCPTVGWDSKHRALGDARAALRVYRAIQRMEVPRESESIRRQSQSH